MILKLNYDSRVWEQVEVAIDAAFRLTAIKEFILL